MNKLCIIVPCYNEEAVLGSTAETLINLLGDLSGKGKTANDSFILLVNDGSHDKTWDVICDLHEKYHQINAINLAANVGHQNALFAGLEYAADKCDMSVSIDADLQDDIGAIEKMVDKYIGGADIVYGVRDDRSSDSFFKRSTAQGFYKFMSAMGVKTVYNHADFRLMSRRAMEQLKLYPERNLFLRGIIPTLGYKTDTVYYARRVRTAGKSKYPLKSMLRLAFNGITSFTTRPMTLIGGLGIVIIILSVIAFIYTLISYFTGNAEPGWASLMASIWFLGGVQLFSIGVVGKYVGKAYFETKQRPRYNISEELKHD